MLCARIASSPSRTLPHTILACRDQLVHSHDERFADLLKNTRNICVNLGMNYVCGVNCFSGSIGQACILVE